MQADNTNLRRWILVANLLIMLFPPIHLSFASGSMKMAIGYFLGSGLILVLSMVLLRSTDHNLGEE